MSELIRVELAQRTPFLLAYLVSKDDALGRLADIRNVEIGPERLEADAVRWRDRPIHKLVTSAATGIVDAFRLFQGVGLVEPGDAGVLRGRLTIVPGTADAWGVTPIHRNGRGGILVDVPQVAHETMALVILEIERNR